ncbi:hypothetical protein LSUB1_G000985 [Lachnellula subtilissima]|uniref:Uncharacterized protein n=1 Tax=Lachnellula subtilissima TaxID=602034 RepID=A0A8H8UGI9_9HELO|nr:hypothetical protein LSUB1_G000985 [Lachnellula subtilissima]
MASFPNVYTHRKVADTASKSCEICYKPSTSVLVTPESKVSIGSSITSVGTAKSPKGQRILYPHN